jgi:hypothetical protein
MMAKGSSPVIFSTTESGDSWLRCDTAAYYGSLNGLGLEKPVPGEALSLGSLFHYTMADWGALYAKTQDVLPGGRALPAPDPLAIFEAHFGAFKTDVYARYGAYNGSEMDDDEWEQRYEEPVGEMGRAIVTNYHRRWGTPYPEDCTLIAPEQTIIVPVPKVLKRQRQLYIEGTLDQLLADQNGEVLVRDFKTFNAKPTDYELEANDQFMTYAWMVTQEFPQYSVAGVVYDGVWKRTAITSRMRDKTEDDLQHRVFLYYNEDKLANHARILPYRLFSIYRKLNARRRLGPDALDRHRSWATCPGCSFNDPCQQLLDGDFGEWNDEAEQEALSEYRHRQKSPAWRVPLPDLTAKLAA